MARIRTIKPEFWDNEVLGTMPADVQLFFIGLWNLCDRRGFVEYRPARLKAKIFPYRDFDVEAAISLLKSEFVRIIEIENVWYLHVINFEKHQVCNVKEQESIIPAQYWHSTNTVQALQEGKGKEGKGKEWNNKEDSNSSFVFYEKDKRLLFDRLTQPRQQVENLIRVFKNKSITVTENQLRKKIIEYIDWVSVNNDWGKPLTEYRKHCNNWLLKNVKEDSSQKIYR